MTDGPLAYRDGRFLPAEQAAVPVQDAGFVQGTVVAEQLRTFSGRLFRLEQHLRRLKRSLSVVGLDETVDFDRLAADVTRLSDHNHRFLPAGSDQGLCLFVTPGPYAAMAIDLPGEVRRPLVCAHTFRLPFHFWAEKYRTGQVLVTAKTRQVPANCWPAELKCRSRMHYYLADREAMAVRPDARALLLDQEGFVAEASTANVLAYCADQGLLSPPMEKILPGISIAVAAQLAGDMDVSIRYRDMTEMDVAGADEVFLCSTSSCLLPVARLNDRPIGEGRPGPMFQRLMSAWSELVGVDIQQQAIRFAREPNAGNRP